MTILTDPQQVKQLNDKYFSDQLNVVQGSQQPITQEQVNFRIDNDVKWALETYKNVAPTTAAKVSSIAQRQGLTFNSVLQNKEDMENLEKIQETYHAVIEKDSNGNFKYPYVADWLTNPENSAIARDDVNTLKELEVLISQQNQKDENVFQKTKRATDFGILQLGESVAKIPAFAYSSSKMLGADLLGLEADVAPPEWLLNNPIAKYYSDQADKVMPIAIQENFFEQIGEQDYSGAVENLLLSAISNAPQMVVAIGSAAAGAPFLGGTFIASTAGAEAFEQKLETAEGEQAVAHGILSGSIEGAAEMLGGMAIIRNIEKGIVKQFGKNASKKFFKEFGETLAEKGIWDAVKLTGRQVQEPVLLAMQSGLVEGGEEFVTEWGQSFSDFITGNNEAFEGIAQRSTFAGLVGATMGIGGFGGGVAVNNATKYFKYKRDIENFDKQLKLVEDSKLKDSPEKLKEAMDNITNGTNSDPDVYFDAEDVEMLMQEKPEEASEFIKNMGIEKEIANGKKTGEDIKVDKNDFITKYAGTETLETLKRIMKFESGGISEVNEEQAVNQFNEQIEDLREKSIEIEEEIRLPQQVETIRTQLMEAGQKAEDIDAQLSVLMSGAKVLSSKRGETTEQWFDRVNPVLKIGGKFVTKKSDGITYNQETGQINQNKNFKKWFGDSKVVDEKGKPLVVYHGSPNKFDIFSLDKIGTNATGEGFGLYFADNKNLAEKFKPVGDGSLFNVYLNIKKPLIENKRQITKTQLRNIFKELYKKDNDALSNYGDVTFSGVNNVLNEAIELENEAVDDAELIGSIINGGVAPLKDVLDTVTKVTGYDGISAKYADGSNIYLAFSPTQIKSVDNQGTFAVDDPNIFKQDDKIIRGGIQFSDSETIINLFESSNMSTFLHETAHIFSRDIQSLIKEGQADEQLRDDYNTILNFVDGKLDTKGEEKFARAFEAYLREGKAPSVKLASAFEKFKKWLTNIYRSIKDLNVNINDEVRGVFDRILASNQDINEAESYYKTRESYNALIDTKVTKPQKEKLDTKLVKADERSKEIEVEKSLKAYEKAIGGKKAYQDQATREINNIPVYQAMDEAIEKGSLNSIDIESEYGKETVQDLKANHKKLLKRKGEVTVSEIALTYEYETEQELINAMLAVKDKKQAINDRALELQNQVEDNIREAQRTQEEIPGEESFHNDKMLEFLIAEWQVLKDKVSRDERSSIRKVERKALKDEAHKIVYNKKVRNATRYDLSAKTEQKYAKQGIDYAKDGKFEEAVEAKRKQALNHAIVQESVKARDQKIKIEDRYKTKKIEGRLKNVENDYAEISSNLIANYGLNKTKNFEATEKNEINRLKDLNEVAYSETPDWILNGEFKGDYRELKMEQLIELDDTIKSLMRIGSKELRSLKDTKHETTEDIVADSVENMSNLKDVKVFGSDAPMFQNKIVNGIRKLAADNKMVAFEFDRLDNNSVERTGKFGILGQIDNKATEAEVVSEDLKQDMFENKLRNSMDILSRATTRLNKKYGVGKFDRVAKFDIDGVPATPEMIREGESKWTPDKVFSFVLNMGNQSNIDALENGYGWDAQQRNRIAGELTVQELKAVQEIWDGIQTLKPKIDKVHFNLTNRKMGNIESQKITITNFEGETVTLDGGYYPLVFDERLSYEAEDIKDKQKVLDDMEINRNKNMFRRVSPKDGFKNSRVEGHSLPPKLSMGTLLTHINDVTRYISHAEYMHDLNNIIRNKKWKANVIAKSGRPFYKEIKRWSSYQANPQTKSDNALLKIINDQKGKATIAALVPSLGVPAKQRLSMFNAARLIGWKYIAKGMQQSGLKTAAFGLKSSEQYDNLLKISNYMRIRSKNNLHFISEIINKVQLKDKIYKIGDIEFTKKQVENMLFELIQMNDRATVTPVWYGAFQKYSDNNFKGQPTKEEIKEAVQYADRIIQRTQPSSLPKDLIEVQRNEWMRIWSSFGTFMFKLNNMATSDKKLMSDGVISKMEFFRRQLYNFVAPGIAAAIIGQLARGDGLPERIEEWANLFATAPIDTYIGSIPFIRGISGLKYGRGVLSTPAEEGITRAFRAAKGLKKSLFNDQEWAKTLWQIGYAVEFQMKLPALGVAKKINKVYDGTKED